MYYGSNAPVLIALSDGVKKENRLSCDKRLGQGRVVLIKDLFKKVTDIISEIGPVGRTPLDKCL